MGLAKAPHRELGYVPACALFSNSVGDNQMHAGQKWQQVHRPDQAPDQPQPEIRHAYIEVQRSNLPACRSRPCLHIKVLGGRCGVS